MYDSPKTLIGAAQSIPAKEAPVKEVLQRLGLAVSILEELISALDERTHMIRQPLPESTAKDKRITHAYSPVLNVIDENACRVEHASDRIRYILESMEI